MSAYPAYVMGGLCIIGGITGFARTRSIPSLVAGVGVGLLYLWSADSIRKGAPNGIEGALGKPPTDSSPYTLLTKNTGASALLLVSSLPRVAKGPVPAILATTSTAAGLYYGNKYLALR
ncbi:hypothetical protein PTI98_007560 [Pleurotus ostreatus]|nr:hypothetical protein PTI98_007560 [Pleurotus ostreatus]